MKKRNMEFHGGLFGALLPFLVMVVIMIILTVTKITVSNASGLLAWRRCV